MENHRDAPPPDPYSGESHSRDEAVSIVAPTFRESENIAALAERIDAALSSRGIEWELILSDDDSDDGSEAAAAELAKRLPVRLEVRRERPRDLSLSVLRGIRLARFDRLVVMDADLSHAPEFITNLLDALNGDCDMVVGSRYLAGGRFERNWGPWRFLNSRLATLLALPLVDCTDPMSGFFAINRRALPDPENLHPIGYKIALELMVRGRLRVRESPIGFSGRNQGSSKMNWRQQLNYLRHLHRLYLYKFGGVARFLYFCLVGASGFVIDLSCYLGLQWAGVEHRVARFLSFWPAVSWNWRLNRGITFSDAPRRPRTRQWAKFVASSLLGFIVNVGSYTMLTSFVDLFERHRILALVCGVGLGSIVNFLAATLYVYRRHSAKPGPGTPAASRG